MKPSMWKIIRENANLKQTDVAKVFGKTKQAINSYEKKGMPIYLQIYYLRLRGLKEDLMIADYLENLK